MKPVLIASLLVVFLTACSSVKLDSAPVEDKSGNLVGKGVDAGGKGSAAGGAGGAAGAGGTAGGAAGAGGTAGMGGAAGTGGTAGGAAGAGGTAGGAAGAGGTAGGAAGAGGTAGAGAAASAVAPFNTAIKQQPVQDLQISSKVVYFDYDSSAIKPEFQVVVEAHARVLRADKTRRVALEGHTDATGGREYNLALGQKRADAVRSAMSLLGVPDSQMEAVSFGMEKPAAQGSDEASLAKNRRVEIN